jgi:hypothetical protein
MKADPKHLLFHCSPRSVLKFYLLVLVVWREATDSCSILNLKIPFVCLQISKELEAFCIYFVFFHLVEIYTYVVVLIPLLPSPEQAQSQNFSCRDKDFYPFFFFL